MKLFTAEQERRMRANGAANAERSARGKATIDFKPLVKLFCPWGGATWLLTEIDPDDSDIAFGLCDLGMGFPELGSISLSEITAVTSPGGLRIERDRWFRADKTLAAYAEEASRAADCRLSAQDKLVWSARTNALLPNGCGLTGQRGELLRGVNEGEGVQELPPPHEITIDFRQRRLVADLLPKILDRPYLMRGDFNSLINTEQE